MKRTVGRALQTLVDLLVLSAALWLAFAIRFDWDIPGPMLRRAMFNWPWVVAFQFGLLSAMGVPRIAWRYVGLRDALQIGLASTLAALGLLVTRFAAVALKSTWPPIELALLPLGVTAIDFVLAFLGVAGARVVRRLLAERAALTDNRLHLPSRRAVKTLLVGAGQGGLMVIKEIASRPDLAVQVIGFVDDDPVKVGTLLHGFPVLGTTADLAALVERHGAEEAIICVSNAPGATIRLISERCRAAGLATKILPGLHEIVGGRVNLSRIRNVAIEDVLRREPIVLDDAGIRQFVFGRSVMVTGAGGSIGSELCRQIRHFEPAVLVLVDRSENNLFEIHRELAALELGFDLVPAVADIGDSERMRHIMRTFGPSVVFHAAAHKHVPMMERDPGEGVKNNVLGTRAMANLADELGAGVFVMVSTDKAVNPTSVMGATKRAAEMYIQALSSRSKTRFVTVRFGNVLGSSGSVIPIFRQQIAAGGPVTVTHPDMVRYFMTIPEACQLVLQAGSMGKGGEIFVLDMGEPVKILDLAHDLIRLSGFHEDEIRITFSGTRPGEKLFEELSLTDENAEKTQHPKVFIGRTRAWDWEHVELGIASLVDSLRAADPSAVQEALARVVPEYGQSRLPSVRPESPQAARKVAQPSGDLQSCGARQPDGGDA